MQVATDPQISPDGKRIVYARQSEDIASDRRVSNLWIVSFDGTEHRPLTITHGCETLDLKLSLPSTTAGTAQSPG